MKYQIQPAGFNPALKQIDFSSTPGFGLAGLLLVANAKTGKILYDPMSSGYGGTLAGSVLTYVADDPGASAGDPLIVLYEDQRVPAGDDTLHGVLARLDQPLAGHLYHPDHGLPVDVRRPLPVADVKPRLICRGFRADELALSWAGTSGMKFDTFEAVTSSTYEFAIGGEHTALYANVYNWQGYGGVVGSNYSINEFAFTGRVFGLRISILGSLTPFAKFGVLIDGVAYRVPAEPALLPQFVSSDNQQLLRTIMFADDLPPGRHHVQLHFPADKYNNQSWFIPEMIIEDDGLNRDHPPGAIFPRIAGVAIGTGGSWTEINPRSGGYASQGLALLSVTFVNTTTSPVSVSYRPKMANGQAMTYPPSVTVPAAAGTNTFNGAVTIRPSGGEEARWYQAIEATASSTGVYAQYEYRRA